MALLRSMEMCLLGMFLELRKLIQCLKVRQSFNQDLSSWDVGGVSDMRDMFNGATAFNGDISSMGCE